MVSFLPLSHVTAQMADFSRLLVSRRPVLVSFGEPEIVMSRIHELLKVVKPTELIAVPRVYEKWQSFINVDYHPRNIRYLSSFKMGQLEGQWR